MARSCCVLCGQELGFLRRQSIDFYGIEQPLCADCKDRYTRTEGEARAHLDQKLLASPRLEARDHILSIRAEQEEEVRRKQAHAELLAQKLAHRKVSLSCCGREMTPLGVSRFQLGEYGFFTGSVSNLSEGSLEMSVYQCEACGQFKFFKPIPIEA